MVPEISGRKRERRTAEYLAHAAAAPATVGGKRGVNAVTGQPGRPDAGHGPASQETCHRRRIDCLGGVPQGEVPCEPPLAC